MAAADDKTQTEAPSVLEATTFRRPSRERPAAPPAPAASATPTPPPAPVPARAPTVFRVRTPRQVSVGGQIVVLRTGDTVALSDHGPDGFGRLLAACPDAEMVR